MVKERIEGLALNGKVILIAGASSGMGRAAALWLKGSGAQLVLTARRLAALEEVAAAIPGCLALAADAADFKQVERVVEEARARFGRIDVLVNSVGDNLPGRSLAALEPEAWERMIRVNLTAAFHLVHAALPAMRAQGGGLIIHISSISALRGDQSGVAYQAAKAGVLALSRGTEFEESKNNIRSSVILPGLCDTPILAKRPQPPSREVLDQALRPEDVARCVAFIAGLPERVLVPELVVVPAALQNPPFREKLDASTP